MQYTINYTVKDEIEDRKLKCIVYLISMISGIHALISVMVPSGILLTAATLIDTFNLLFILSLQNLLYSS